MKFDLFNKTACVKEWAGAAEQREIAIGSVAAVENSPYVISANIAFVYDGETGQCPKNDDFASLFAAVVVDNNWEELEFGDLAEALRAHFNAMPKPLQEGLAETEVYLHQSTVGIKDEEDIYSEAPISSDKTPAKPVKVKHLEPTQSHHGLKI